MGTALPQCTRQPSCAESPGKRARQRSEDGPTVPPRQTVKMSGFAWTVLCILWVWFPMGCLQPIATQELFPRLHPRDPARPVVTFAALGDMGDGGSAQLDVAQAMASVCQR